MARRKRASVPVQAEVNYLMTASQSLFVEVFPVNVSALPPLTAYRIAVSKGSPDEIGAKLAARLSEVASGCWVWVGERLLTDSALNPVKLLMTIDQIRADEPKSFGSLEVVEEDYGWRVTAAAVADYVVEGLMLPLDPAIREALATTSVRAGTLQVDHTYQAQPWSVGGQ